MKTLYAANRRGNTTAFLFIAVSLLVSACSPSMPLETGTSNQTAPNAAQPEPHPAAVTVPNTAPNTPQITIPTPTPNVTLNTTPTPPPPQITTPNATPEPAPNVTPNATLLSYAKKIQPIFNMFCASPTCHDGTGNTTLNLQPAVSFKQLVNIPSDFLKSKLRVKPGAPEQSVIMIMVNDPQHATVPSSVIDTIKQWILEGATNN